LQAKRSPEEAAVLQFADDKLQAVLAHLRQQQQQQQPQEEGSSTGSSSGSSDSCPIELHFLHAANEQQHTGSGSGSNADDAPATAARQTVVRAPSAFDSPMTYQEYVQGMRDQAELLRATAALLVVPKSCMAFPQVCVCVCVRACVCVCVASAAAAADM
jgi:predicted component of type VI protein secretion system